ncbi:MAG: glycine cleavage system protein GcvH [Verrucomicrobiales bacterium]|nr:glycine cleavage system protein GcvH [Verrucomicrobiales bacterium]
MNIPDQLKYAESHEWTELDGEVAKVGISDHAQAELTDVVYVELPEIGNVVEAGDPVAVVESVKAASDIFAPVGGEIVEVNDAVQDDPSLVNTDPYGAGWLFKIKTEDASPLEALFDADAYGAHIS